MNTPSRPLQSLKQGHWFKLICGASFQHLPAIRSLTLAYALAGADCVDVAADPAVVTAAREAIQDATFLLEDAHQRGFNTQGSPLLMVSLNDGEDPHFRKAAFNAAACPQDCLRPCETICPAQAITFSQIVDQFSGVIEERCYGCGRCIPVCPIQHIQAHSYQIPPHRIAPLILQGVDAVEIHTQIGRLTEFMRVWEAIAPYLSSLQLIAISCPDGEDLLEYLWAIYQHITPLPCPVIWQTDGRPMSGDIGDGTTHAAVKLGQKVLAAGLPGYVQLAGGTNRHTVPKLRALGLLRTPDSSIQPFPLTCQPHHQAYNTPDQQEENYSPRYIAGVAYGSYARILLSPVLDQLEKSNTNVQLVNSQPTLATTYRQLESEPELLWQAVGFADALVSQLKPPNPMILNSVNSVPPRFNPSPRLPRPFHSPD